VNVDPTTQINFKALSASKFDNIRRIADDAFAIFARVAPELGAEIRSLLTEIVFVSGVPNESLRFDGATSFFCWGALFLNADAYCSLVKMIDGLSHETAHAYLFALSLGDSFVDNPDDELHPSPLRADPRPLDGTFHATYVSARMHYALSQVIESGLLSRSEENEARKAVAASCAAFSDGFKTLSDYASVTALGRQVMGAARSYMVEQAGVQLDL
jgi:HEXXH motif-containing protein